MKKVTCKLVHKHCGFTRRILIIFRKAVATMQYLLTGDLVTPMIITLSSCFMVFRIFGRAFFTLLGSVCSQIDTQFFTFQLEWPVVAKTKSTCYSKRDSKLPVPIKTVLRWQTLVRHKSHNIEF